MEVRKFKTTDKQIFIAFAEQFYSTDSVAHSIPSAYIQSAFNEIISDSPYIDGFMIFHKDQPAGYALLVYTYSMEIGGMLAILDELFITPDFQGKGLGSQFIQHMKRKLSEGIKAFRLEFVPDKKHLKRLYRKYGFQSLPYTAMVQELD